MKRMVQIGLGALVVVVACAASFYGGMLYGKGQNKTGTVARTAAGYPTGGDMPNQQGGRGTGQDTTTRQGGMLSGEIQEITAQGLTIKDTSGKTVEIKVTDTTLIQAQATLNLADLKKGQSIMASASQGSDGTYTARSMQVVDSAMLEAAPSTDTGTGTQGGGFPGGGFPGGGFPGGTTRP